MEPRFDQSEYDNGINQIKAILPNLMTQPNYKFAAALYKLLYNDNPRQRQLGPETLENASLSAIERNWRMLFNDAAGANMVIVGDVDLETLKPLVEQYIGSIPAGKTPLKWVDPELNIVQGKVSEEIAVDMQTPKSTVIQVYSADMPYSAETKAALDVIQYVLDMRYVNSLREEEGGTYGASTSCELTRKPKGPHPGLFRLQAGPLRQALPDCPERHQRARRQRPDRRRIHRSHPQPEEEPAREPRQQLLLAQQHPAVPRVRQRCRRRPRSGPQCPQQAGCPAGPAGTARRRQ